MGNYPPESSHIQEQLELLAKYLANIQDQPPWTHTLIAEDRSIIHEKKLRISRTALKTPQEYDVDFMVHCSMGYHWINLTALGILDGVLLVAVELPVHHYDSARGKTAINFSGPMMINGQLKWDISDRVEIID